MQDNKSATELPKPSGIFATLVYFIKYHFHVIFFFYVVFGLIFCGLLAPSERVAELGSNIITEGWHLSVLAAILSLPWPILYVIRFVRSK